MAIKNVALTVIFRAFDTAANTWKTGDSANFTLNLIGDGADLGAPTNAGSITEPDSINSPGGYAITLTAGEMNYDFVELHGTSSTSDVIILPLQIVTEQGEFADIADNVWDEILTGATHNIPTSAGRRLRELADRVITTGTAQAGTVNTITLAAGASATDGAYDPAVICIVGGTGEGQSRMILEYDGTTKVAVVDRDWKVTPDATTEYQIECHPGREHVNEGLAQAGGASTITLNTLASSADDAYNSQIVFIRSGAGADQARVIIDYNGTTKVATVDRAWDVTPGVTSGYVILPDGLSGIVAVDGEAVTSTDDLKADVSDIPTNSELATALQNALGTNASDLAAELSAIPAAAVSLADAIQLIYMMVRNGGQVTTAERRINKDDGNALGTGTLNDDGTTTTIGELS